MKARYSRGLKAALQLAKGHVRYAVHRCNEQGQRQYREVWDRDGRIGKTGAYERIDRVHHNDYVYRLMLSPHPEHQDAAHQLDLQAWTQQVMASLERDMDRRLEWFAVSHEHSEHRHVHVVAVSRQRLDPRHFTSIRKAGDREAANQERQRSESRNRGRDRQMSMSGTHRPSEARDARRSALTEVPRRAPDRGGLR